MRRRLFLGFLAALLLVAPGLSQVALAKEVPLIPREIMVGNPTKASPRISPDGTRLSYLAPSEKGVLNVWVRTIGKEDDRMVTSDEYRGIRIHFWAQVDVFVGIHSQPGMTERQRNFQIMPLMYNFPQ